MTAIEKTKTKNFSKFNFIISTNERARNVSPFEQVRALVALEGDDTQVRDAQVHLIAFLVLQQDDNL